MPALLAEAVSTKPGFPNVHVDTQGQIWRSTSQDTVTLAPMELFGFREGEFILFPLADNPGPVGCHSG